jgi:hypothetical protein
MLGRLGIQQSHLEFSALSGGFALAKTKAFAGYCLTLTHRKPIKTGLAKIIFQAGETDIFKK